MRFSLQNETLQYNIKYNPPTHLRNLSAFVIPS